MNGSQFFAAMLFLAIAVYGVKLHEKLSSGHTMVIGTISIPSNIWGEICAWLIFSFGCIGSTLWVHDSSEWEYPLLSTEIVVFLVLFAMLVGFHLKSNTQWTTRKVVIVSISLTLSIGLLPFVLAVL